MLQLDSFNPAVLCMNCLLLINPDERRTTCFTLGEVDLCRHAPTDCYKRPTVGGEDVEVALEYVCGVSC